MPDPEDIWSQFPDADPSDAEALLRNAVPFQLLPPGAPSPSLPAPSQSALGSPVPFASSAPKSPVINGQTVDEFVNTQQKSQPQFGMFGRGADTSPPPGWFIGPDIDYRTANKGVTMAGGIQIPPLLPNGVPLNQKWSTALALLNDKRVRALLATIRDKEANGQYDVLVGGKHVDDLAAYPNFYNADQNSTAAGAYQFIRRTWNSEAKALDLDDFSAGSQDLAAVDLLNYLRAISNLQRGNVNAAIFAAGRQWDALPKDVQGHHIAKAGTRSLQDIRSDYFRHLRTGDD